MPHNPLQTNLTKPLRDLDRLTVIYLLSTLLLLYYVIPLVALLLAQPPTRILRQLTTPTVITAATNSLATATLTTILATFFGIPLGYWLARTTARPKPLINAIVILPLVLPPTVSGIVLLSVIGPNTLLGQTATTLGIPLTRSHLGIVLAQTFVASPFVVITAKAAFGAIDPQIEHASRSLGKTRWTTYRRITLPLAWSGILAGITLAFARAIGEFGATLMLAYYPRTMPVQIWVSFIEYGLTQAYPIAIILLGIAIAAIMLLSTTHRSPWGG